LPEAAAPANLSRAVRSEETHVIDLYTWSTGNGRKVLFFLEETGLPYRLHMVDIHGDEQFKPEFLAISPNNKIPAIVDQDGPGGKPLSLFESGAILIYLAEKTGRFMPQDPAGRYRVIEWVLFQAANIGPMLGQTHHFRSKAREVIPYAIARYTDEATRLYRVLETRLDEAEYLAGDYSIADMMTYPWLRNPARDGQDIKDYPNIARWFKAIDTRPAVQRAHRIIEAAAEKHRSLQAAV
jgi:GSH-dependent disulfide-bond oxidoreductase